MGNEVLTKIREILKDAGCNFREISHEPTTTSEASALARGEPLHVGGKALVLKCDDSFGIFVISATRKLNTKEIRRHLGVKSIRFANQEELWAQTGLVPGSVPPLGRPLFDLPLYVDESVVANDRIAFNAGSLTDSIVLAVSDYLTVAHPKIFSFSTD